MGRQKKEAGDPVPFEIISTGPEGQERRRASAAEVEQTILSVLRSGGKTFGGLARMEFDFGALRVRVRRVADGKKEEG